MIDVKVRKRLGQFFLDAEMEDSGFICLAGRNGSGKTSLMRVIAGLLAPDEGYVRINGIDSTNLSVERRGVVMVTTSSFLPHLDVDSHMVWGARLKRMSPSAEEISRVRDELGIDFRGEMRKLSLGMRERVTLATALLSSPKVILVDEAFSNLHDREDFLQRYRKLAAGVGADVMFSTQDRSDGSFSDHTYLLTEGKTTRLA